MDPRRTAHRELVVVAGALIGLSRLLDGPLVWAVAILVLGFMLVATLAVLGEVEPRGVPVEALLPPSVMAVAVLAAIRLVPVGFALVPAVLVGAILIERTLVLEARVLLRPQGSTEDDRALVLAFTLLAAFLAFTGTAALVPGGLVEPPSGSGLPAPPIPEGALILLAFGDALAAALLGYRLAAMRETTVREALWGAGTHGAIVGLSAAVLRAAALPRLLGPALLVVIFYLWNLYRGSPRSVRRSARWLWEALLLIGLAVVVVGWNLLLRR